jgi:hypothetical protein
MTYEGVRFVGWTSNLQSQNGANSKTFLAELASWLSTNVSKKKATVRQQDDGFLGVVQFMHPGHEHRVDKNGWTAWNLKDHRRKYMVTRGQHLDKSMQPSFSEQYFWGEWEGPSRSIFNWESNDKSLPNHLVVPEFPGSAMPVQGLQNTDPYVFGDAFKYTLCKQVNKNGSRSLLTRLLPGTLVLFGSRVNQQFVLDTAFVIGENTLNHSMADWTTVLKDCSAAYRSMTLEPTYWDRNTSKSVPFTYYEGAGFQSQINSTFSFAPCIPATNVPQQFARPAIHLPGIISNELMMNFKATQMSHADISYWWKEVVSQVFANKLSLGVRFEEPFLTNVPDGVMPR